MNSKPGNIKLYLLYLIALLLICNILYFSLSRGEVLNDSCVSVLRTEAHAGDFMSTETATLVLNPNKTGFIGFSGVINSNGKTMVMARDIRFGYLKESERIYKMINIETVKYPRDNAPDSLIDSMFFSTKNETARYMVVGKFMNSYIIGNLHSPVFICVVK